MIERPPSDAPRGLCPVRGGCSARGCAAMRAGCGGLPCALRVTDPLDAPARVVSGVRWLQCARLRCDARCCSGLPCAPRVTDPLDASARIVSGVRWLQCARLRCDARGCAPRCARSCAPRCCSCAGVSATDRGQMRRNIKARFTSWIALVTWMPRGQASVQLKVVRQRQTPSESERISSRSCAA